MARWWEHERFNVANTYEWRLRYSAWGVPLWLTAISPGYIREPHWQVWVAVGFTPVAVWMTTIFALMARQDLMAFKARREYWDRYEAELRRRYGLDEPGAGQ